MSRYVSNVGKPYSIGQGNHEVEGVQEAEVAEGRGMGSQANGIGD